MLNSDDDRQTRLIRSREAYERHSESGLWHKDTATCTTRTSLKGIRKQGTRFEWDVERWEWKKQELQKQEEEEKLKVTPFGGGTQNPVFGSLDTCFWYISSQIMATGQFTYNNIKGDMEDIVHMNLNRPVKKKPSLKKLLKEAEKKKEKLDKLKSKGNLETVTRIQSSSAWKSALAKSEGKVVKDDVRRIKKTIKRVVKKKEKSRKLWKDRKETVKAKQESRQKKRQRNIETRKEKKKEAKIKHLKKKGRIF